jgi:hypothetical protein
VGTISAQVKDYIVNKSLLYSGEGINKSLLYSGEGVNKSLLNSGEGVNKSFLLLPFNATCSTKKQQIAII